VNATIGANGVPQQLNISSGNLMLAGGVLNAIRLWRYTPAQLNGKPIEAQIEIVVKFQATRE
jgi:outer membrane biosynthesis protein TonB